jgi:hypothetical protein
VRVSSRHLGEVQHYIEEGIASKGKVLTENHALTLRGMALDNAFVDMQRLVEHTVQNDADEPVPGSEPVLEEPDDPARHALERRSE